MKNNMYLQKKLQKVPNPESLILIEFLTKIKTCNVRLQNFVCIIILIMLSYMKNQCSLLKKTRKTKQNKRAMRSGKIYKNFIKGVSLASWRLRTDLLPALKFFSLVF